MNKEQWMWMRASVALVAAAAAAMKHPPVLPQPIAGR
jgi:hypothetical protein